MSTHTVTPRRLASLTHLASTNSSVNLGRELAAVDLEDLSVYGHLGPDCLEHVTEYQHALREREWEES